VTISIHPRTALVEATSSRRKELSESGFIEALAAGDFTLWGEAAEPEASIRLGWTAPPAKWGDVAGEITALRSELREAGISRVVLCGMGGSSLGPEVMAASAGLPLSVIDSTHPEEIYPELTKDLSDAVIVVSSKSGGTVETDSQKRAFESALSAQGLDPARHIVVVTDPGSPLHRASREAGYRVFEGDSTIGGRFSAVSPFGLVPAGLAGLDLDTFLAEATAGFRACTEPGLENPALMLGVAIAHRHPVVNKLLYRFDPALPGFGDWVEQLVAESTGKDGKGILPVVSSSLDAIPDALSLGPTGSGSDVEVSGTLGGQIILWEYATAIACAEIGVNPFDQPNVESAKVAARELLESPTEETRKEISLEGLSVFLDPPAPALRALTDLPSVLGSLAGGRGYIALCVFAPRNAEASWRECARQLEFSTGRPVTVGFGPRFLHSTGQLHKGGAPEGVFLQIIQTTDIEVEIPGRNFDFWQLLKSQAHGDARVVVDSGQPVLSLTGNRDDMSRLQKALSA
jgi:hypothetical protein